MIQQSAGLYGDKPVFLVKDPRAIASRLLRRLKQAALGFGLSPLSARHLSKIARDVDALGTWFSNSRYRAAGSPSWLRLAMNGMSPTWRR